MSIQIDIGYAKILSPYLTNNIPFHDVLIKKIFEHGKVLIPTLLNSSLNILRSNIVGQNRLDFLFIDHHRDSRTKNGLLFKEGLDAFDNVHQWSI